MSLFQTFEIIFSHSLTQKQRFAVYTRWLQWQFGSRKSLGASVVEFVGGTRLLAQSGMTGATGNIYCGLHEYRDIDFVLYFLRIGDFLGCCRQQDRKRCRDEYKRER